MPGPTEPGEGHVREGRIHVRGKDRAGRFPAHGFERARQGAHSDPPDLSAIGRRRRAEVVHPVGVLPGETPACGTPRSPACLGWAGSQPAMSMIHGSGAPYFRRPARRCRSARPAVPERVRRARDPEQHPTESLGARDGLRLRKNPGARTPAGRLPRRRKQAPREASGSPRPFVKTHSKPSRRRGRPGGGDVR